MPFTRRTLLGVAVAAAMACVAATPAQAAKPLTIGFSQVGAESEWRTANTASIKAAARQANINLKFADAQQQQQNQVKAIRSFIAQRVDVIAFSPVVETGWETVLREAKNAKIPVILTDRAVKVSDPSLYVSFIGSDSSKRAAAPGAGCWTTRRRTATSRSTSSNCRAPSVRRRPPTARTVLPKSSPAIRS